MGSDDSNKRKRASHEETKSILPSIFFKDTGKYAGAGDPLPVDMPRDEAPVPDGCFAVFPIRRDGLEVSWALQTETFKMKIEKGYIKFAAGILVIQIEQWHIYKPGQ